MNRYFNFERIWNNSFFTHYKLKTVLDYLDNDGPLRTYIDSREYIGYDNNGQAIEEPPEFRNNLFKANRRDINDSIKVILNQMIVYMATYLELINNEFFYCIFINDSKKIRYCYKISEEAKAALGFSFDEFIEHATKDDYLSIITERAAKICSNGTVEKIMKRIHELTDISFTKEVKDSLTEIESKRNEIIHENKLFDLNFEYIEKLRDDLESYLKSIAKTLKKEGISVIDNAGLLDE